MLSNTTFYDKISILRSRLKYYENPSKLIEFDAPTSKKMLGPTTSKSISGLTFERSGSDLKIEPNQGRQDLGDSPRFHSQT